MSELALVDVFEQMPDSRRKQGRRHSLQWCLAWFSQAVAARNRGFLSMGTGSKVRLEETVGCRGFAILQYHQAHLAGTRSAGVFSSVGTFFVGIRPVAAETVGLDGKVLRGSVSTGRGSP